MVQLSKPIIGDLPAGVTLRFQTTGGEVTLTGMTLVLSKPLTAPIPSGATLQFIDPVQPDYASGTDPLAATHSHATDTRDQSNTTAWMSAGLGDGRSVLGLGVGMLDSYERCKATRRCPRAFEHYNVTAGAVRFTHKLHNGG